MRLVSATALLPLVASHFQMTIPPTRFHDTPHGSGIHGPGYLGNVTCEPEPGPKLGGYGCLWFSQGCAPGCSKCTDRVLGHDFCSEKGGGMKPTLNDPKLRTFTNQYIFYDVTRHNPWRSPGYAPVFSPCGLAGGGIFPFRPNGARAPSGVKQGLDGRDMKEGPKTQWPQGSVQEVAFSITANHGGGYAYRLCPKSGALTEECFQNHQLQYASAETSWIQFGNDTSNRTAIKATRTSQGTNPKGSVWTKNPIPACYWYTGGPGDPNCGKPQFEPPLPGLFGYGSAACFTGAGAGHCTDEQRQIIATHFNFHVLDKVLVPTDLPAGEYLLSFRLDCEETPQVWNQCADITITAKDDVIV